MQNHPDIASLPSALAQSGIDSTEFRSGTLRLEERAGRNIARLQRLPDAPVPGLPGIELPDRIGGCSGADPVALRLGPHEWLLLAEANLTDSLRTAVTEEGDAFWTDLTDGLAVFRLDGAGAPWLLNKLSCLDFQSCHDADEHCARTRMGQVAVVVHFHRTPDGSERFDLVVDRSAARYLWELLCASAPHADDLAKSQGEAA